MQWESYLLLRPTLMITQRSQVTPFRLFCLFLVSDRTGYTSTFTFSVTSIFPLVKKIVLKL